MTKNTDKVLGAAHPQIEEPGLLGGLLMCVKVAAITGVVVLLLKYVLKVPFTL